MMRKSTAAANVHILISHLTQLQSRFAAGHKPDLIPSTGRAHAADQRKQNFELLAKFVDGDDVAAA